ncbi:B-box zinc finger protein [Neisseria weaveri]|uniref:Uncharacterized protein n=1 Tax=Neisseria weaveri TaxID=28091 RepID=A0A3S4Z140_9NEIS|nr:hypothetical protein [Neisseria weaveri]SAY50799.1 Uncharacterised protein [Neisseria weaveri]VEJ49096.1 Uncharacterised protein [Neisseria weaveri]
MRKNYDEEDTYFIPKNKEAELEIARKFQRRLFLSKLFFPYSILMAILLILEKYKIIGNERTNDSLFIWLIIIFWGLALYSIISTMILGKCPYCQNFQQLNGKVKGLDEKSIFYTKGVSPFIKYCNKCKAPLSEKAVREVYHKHNS